jgi:hypothetical protein
MLSQWEIYSSVKGAYLQISKPIDLTTTEYLCQTSQKNEHLIYTAAEARNHAFNITLT